MAKKPEKFPVPKDSWKNRKNLHAAAQGLGNKHRIGFVLVKDNKDFQEYSLQARHKPWGDFSRIAVLWTARRINPAALFSWRCGISGSSGSFLQIIFVPKSDDEMEKADWQEWIVDKLGDWATPVPAKESAAVTVNDFVNCDPASEKNQTGYDPSLLTISPKGVMGKVLDTLDECRRYFNSFEFIAKLDEGREAFHRALEPLLSSNGNDRSFEGIETVLQSHKFHVNRALLPRVLLLGPSGAGKTLVARYLAYTYSAAHPLPFKRVAIPAYLNRESDLEYDLLGYCHGAFTDAREQGSRGVLLQNIGGIVFLDEIGDASPAIQAKLLAYLDDYQVTPRGWSGEPIFCPTLIVAATNRPVDRWAAEDDGGRGATDGRYFRNDLLRRFTHVIKVPSLNQRKEEFEYILDTMLQMEAFNPGGSVKSMGKHAYEILRRHNFDRGNFRELEGMIRMACGSAVHDGRDYVVRSDIPVSRTERKAGYGKEYKYHVSHDQKNIFQIIKKGIIKQTGLMIDSDDEMEGYHVDEYFDDKDSSILNAGASLRMRRESGECYLCFKIRLKNESGACEVRPEIYSRLKEEALMTSDQVQKLRRGERLISLVPYRMMEAVVPMHGKIELKFRITTRRRHVLLKKMPDRTRIGLNLDTIYVTTDRKEHGPFREVEVVCYNSIEPGKTLITWLESIGLEPSCGTKYEFGHRISV